MLFMTSWSSSSHSSTSHHIFPVKSFLFPFHCLHFYRPCSQAKAFLCISGSLDRDLPKAVPGSWFHLCFSVQHQLLTPCSQFPPSLLPQAALLLLLLLSLLFITLLLLLLLLLLSCFGFCFGCFFFSTETLCQVQTIISYS